MPVYHGRVELRKDHFDPTSMILLTYVTMDKATNEIRIMGFRYIIMILLKKYLFFFKIIQKKFLIVLFHYS
jgi:hypothetical protein